MDLCVDCNAPTGADDRCPDCLVEVEESTALGTGRRRSPQWRVKNAAVCAGCGQPFPPGSNPLRRWCSTTCKGRKYYAQRKNVPCAGGCGRLCWGTTGPTSGKPVGQRMCRECRQVATDTARPDCAGCGAHLKTGQQKYCSITCANETLNGGRRPTSPICAGDGCERPHRLHSRFCSRCEEKRIDPAKLKARWRTKNHRRRAVARAAEFDEVTPEYEATLRARTRRCPRCKVWMTGKPYLPNSKELDHIVPLNVGGTHTTGNVRIICRRCNQGRPNDGSDYIGPVTLWAQAS